MTRKSIPHSATTKFFTLKPPSQQCFWNYRKPSFYTKKVFRLAYAHGNGAIM